MLGGGVKVVWVSFGGVARLCVLGWGVAGPAAHGEQEVVVYIVLGLVLGHPDLLFLLEVDHLLEPRVPHLCVVVADGGCKQRYQSTERPVHSTYFYIQLYLPLLNYTRPIKLQFKFLTSE